MQPLLYAPVGAARSGLLRPSAAASSITWETATDWDNATSESGVVHESTTNTDHTDATILKQGYPFGSFSLITPTPIHAWPLHEDSGSTAYDLAGSINGSVSGPTVGQPGLFDTTSFSFDGTDDEVGIGSTKFGFSDGDSISVSVWVKADSSAAGAIVSLWNARFEIARERWSTGTGRYEFRIWDGSNGHVIESTTTTTGSWLHLVGTWDGTDRKFYVNGTQEASDQKEYNSASAGSGIGAESESTLSAEFEGNIMDVRLYDTALTSSQVQTLYDVADTTGSLETDTKSFSSAQSPDLVADVTLNGVTDIAVDVIGSPSGTSETNTVQVNSSGENTYTITWSSSHTNFRVKPKPDNESDVTRTPTINKLELSP